MNENNMNTSPRGTASLFCPACGSANVKIELFQENAGTTTVSKTKSKYRQGGHGLIWWLLIGWWWWIVDLALWILLFVPRLILQIFKPKKKRGKETNIEQSFNQVNYKTICVCQNCGNNWLRSQTSSNFASDVAKNNVKKLKKNVK